MLYSYAKIVYGWNPGESSFQEGVVVEDLEEDVATTEVAFEGGNGSKDYYGGNVLLWVDAGLHPPPPPLQIPTFLCLLHSS